MFGLDSFHQPTISMGDVKNWAAGVRDQHLQEGADPTDSLIKIARERGLTPHQVGVLAGEINKTIHIAKYASVEDKYHAADFPLADSQNALEALQIGDGSEKVAFSLPDPKCEDDFDYDAAFGIQKDVSEEALQEKNASLDTSKLRGEVKTAHMKLARMKQEQDRKAFMTKHARDVAEIDFIKTAQGDILSNSLNAADRLRNLGAIAHACKCAGMYEHARKPLAKLAMVLAERGYVEKDTADKVSEYFLEKNADEVAPQELISEFLRAKVVNGNNPLLISLKTFKDADERAEEEANRKRLVDDRNLIFAQKIRAL